ERGRERARTLWDPATQIGRLRDVMQRMTRPKDSAQNVKPQNFSGGRMRVLHICSGNLYGGVETFLVTLARWRSECPRMESEFTVCFEGRLSNELQAAGVRVHNLGKVRLRYPIAVSRAREQLRKVLSERRFDVGICHSEWTLVLFGSMIRECELP